MQALDENSSLEKLLTDVSPIVSKNNKIADETGANFNIFRILGLSNYEVRLHSSLIAELLDPKGSHGMKDVYLKLFLQELRLIQKNKTLDIDSFQTEKATVEVEKRLGNIDKENWTGGYIDIIIQFPSNKVIIIENKIYARDQEGQLRRYHNFNKDAIIVYLTLNGKEANNDTTKNEENLNDNIKPLLLSYKDGIKGWLELCKTETLKYPIISETISQYIHLIKHLTNQTINDNMKNELAKLIVKNPEYIKSAKEIANVWKECQFQIIETLESDLKDIAKQLNLEYDKDKASRLGQDDSGFWFYKKEWCYCIYFKFDSELEDLVVGVYNISDADKCPDELSSRLKNHLSDFNIGNRRFDPDWFWVSDFPEWASTNWEEIQKKMPKAIFDTSKEILDRLEEFKP